MKNILLSLGFVLIICSISYSRDKVISKILDFSDEYYKHSKCGKFTLNSKFLYSQDLDTFSVSYNCLFKKNKDKYLGATIWVSLNGGSSVTAIYLNKRLTIYNHYDSHEITRVEPPATPGVHGLLNEIPYFRSSDLINEFRAYNILNKAQVKNDMVENGVPCFKISYQEKEIYKEVLISKLDFTIRRIIFISSADKFHGLKYSCKEVIPIEINSDECNSDKLYQFENMVDNVCEIDFTPDMTKIKNDLFVDIDNLNFMSLDSNIISLSEHKGKVILLDYWYLACAPCRKASPEIQNFIEAYNSEYFKAFGINICDTNFDNLRKYVISNSIDYTILFDYNKTDKHLPKTAHPAFLVYDKMGYLVYYDVGYSKEKMKTLASIIEINL